MSATALGNAKLTESPVRQPTILVVEDHNDTREMLHTLLEKWGCRVVEACNGLEAVEAASRERPQLILMDGRLPLLDGLEATRRIRKNGLRDQVKIVALNGSGSPRYHAEALAVGSYFLCHYLLLRLCRISVLSQEVKCQNHDRCYQQ